MVSENWRLILLVNYECEHLDMIGEGIYIGGIVGRYACIILYCNKHDTLCELVEGCDEYD